MRFQTVQIVVVALAFVLAGCGKSDDDKNAAKKPDVAAYGAPADGEASAASATPAADAPAATDALAPAATAIGTKTLEYPDDMQMTMLAYRLTGRTPPLEDWAKQSRVVQSADEFSRADKLKNEIARLKAIYDSTADIGYLTMKLNSNFSEYDASRGGYYLDAFAAGSVFTFGAPYNSEQPVTLQLDNNLKAQFWPMSDPNAAKALLEKNGGQRNVSIVVNIVLTGTQQRSSGTTLTGHIKHFTVYSGKYNSEEILAEISPK